MIYLKYSDFRFHRVTYIIKWLVVDIDLIVLGRLVVNIDLVVNGEDRLVGMLVILAIEGFLVGIPVGVMVLVCC